MFVRAGWENQPARFFWKTASLRALIPIQSPNLTRYCHAYTANLITAAGGNTNPTAGQPAFTGSDGGSVLGTWGRSIVDLSSYAHAKDRIRLRFDLGTDCGTSFFGWYAEDWSVDRCK